MGTSGGDLSGTFVGVGTTSIDVDAAYAGNIANAAAALPSRGGRLWLTKPEYDFTAALVLDNTVGVTLKGAGGLNATTQAAQGAPPATVLKTTSATATLLSGKGSQGLHLEDIGLVYSAADYTGTLVDLTGSAGTPTRYFRHYRGFVGALSGAQLDTGTTPLLQLKDTVDVGWEDVIFAGGHWCVQGRPNVADFANVVNFLRCRFQQYATFALKTAGQDWTFRGCTVEPGSDGQTPQVLQQDHTSPGQGFTWEDGWLGDGGNTSVYFTWCGNGFRIVGGYASMQHDRTLLSIDRDGSTPTATAGINIEGIALDSPSTNAHIINYGTSVDTTDVTVEVDTGPTTPFVGTPGGPVRYRAGGKLYLLSLPTADPHVVGELWANVGVLTVSAG